MPNFSLDIDDDEIRRDINNPNVIKLYGYLDHTSLNDKMDKNDKNVFFDQLRQFYYPEGFFTTNRVAEKGFSLEEINEIAKLLAPFERKLSRKGTAKGGKKKINKRRKSLKKRRPKK